MQINDKCMYYGTQGNEECVILDKKTEYGSSIQNDAMQTMDYTLTTYFKIKYKDKEVWVSGNFLTKLI